MNQASDSVERENRLSSGHQYPGMMRMILRFDLGNFFKVKSLTGCNRIMESCFSLSGAMPSTSFKSDGSEL